MLQAGFAFIYPPLGKVSKLADLFPQESIARNAKADVWNETSFTDLDVPQPRSIPSGQYALMRDTVSEAERIKNEYYQNFGDDWRKDFTESIAAHDLYFFRKASIDPMTHRGKTTRVRSWVVRNFRPLIDITHPSQIEILGEAPRSP